MKTNYTLKDNILTKQMMLTTEELQALKELFCLAEQNNNKFELKEIEIVLAKFNADYNFYNEHIIEMVSSKDLKAEFCLNKNLYTYLKQIWSYRKLDMNKIKEKKSINISSEEALKDVEPYFSKEQLDKLKGNSTIK